MFLIQDLISAVKEYSFCRIVKVNKKAHSDSRINFYHQFSKQVWSSFLDMKQIYVEP